MISVNEKADLIEWVGPYEIKLKFEIDVDHEKLNYHIIIKKDFPNTYIFFWEKYPKHFRTPNECMEFRKKYAHIFEAN
jgi:hypothetical protein